MVGRGSDCSLDVRGSSSRFWATALPVGFFFLAACLAHMDRIDDARREVKAGLEVLPRLTLHRLGPRSDNPVVLAQRERVIEGMRMAGLPEQ